jgi:hypothetical protein
MAYFSHNCYLWDKLQHVDLVSTAEIKLQNIQLASHANNLITHTWSRSQK